MTLEDNKAIVRRHLEAISSGDVRGAAECWAETAHNHGREVTRGDVERTMIALAGLRERHTIHEMVAEGDWVAVRTTCEGIHAVEPSLPVNGGIFEGIPPTGRTYRAQHMHLFRVVDGKITDHWANRDDLGAARQLGRDLARPVT